MAIATNGGHVARALDFYRTEGKYFIIGGTTPWDEETIPTPPSIDDFKLNDVVALKKVDNTHMVVPDENGTIKYREQNWRIVVDEAKTVTSSTMVSGEANVTVDNIAGITVGSKVRIDNLFEAKVTTIVGTTLTLDTTAPKDIDQGAEVLAGAMIEDAKYVYIDCFLNYDQFPVVTYRQVGVCTGVLPNTQDTLRSAKYANGGLDEYTSLGILEILDNRVPSTRDMDQREQLSVVIQF